METQDHKNPIHPEDKDVARAISRKSSNGVGRSDRSTRSEDELFTDAVTEFNESPAIVRQASGGGMQRFYSMENVSQFGVENHIGGTDILGETDLLMDDQLQTFLNVDVEKDEVKAGMASTDVMPGIENSADHEILHTSGKSEESTSTNDKPEHKTSYTETPKGVADEFCGFENNNERLNVLDSANRDKIETYNEVDSPGNLYSPVLQGDAENSGDGNVNKSQLVEGRDSDIGAIHNVLPLEQSPEIEVEDIVFTKSTYSGGLISEDDSVCYSEDKQEEGKQSVSVQKTYGETNHTSDANIDNANFGMFKSEIINDRISAILEDKNDTSTGEKRAITIFPELASDDLVNTIRSNVEDDGEYFTVVDNDSSKISEDTLAVKNLPFVKPTFDDVTLQDVEHSNIRTDMGNDVNITVEGAALNGNETNDGSVVENASTKMGSYEAIDDSKEPDRTIGDSKMDGIPDAGDLTVGHSQGESLFISPGVEEIESSDNIVRKEDCMVDSGTGATLKTDELNSTSKVYVDEDAKNTFCIAEGDRESRQHVTVSAIDCDVNARSSDTIPTTDTFGSNHPQSLEGEEIPSVVSNPLIEKQQSQYQVSPMPAIGIEQIERAPEIYSLNEANRGNKGKEIMTDTTNWDSGKQNTPLKTLLGEATATSRAESPIHQPQTSASTSVPQRDNNLYKTENVIINSEMGKEWNSPARYPVKIKTEKKKSKNKPYWSSFLCCSSVNAR